MFKKLIASRTFTGQDGLPRARWGYRGKNSIDWIIIHYTGDAFAQGQAAKLAKTMQHWKREVSTHYLVGEDFTFQIVEDRHAAWHCGVRAGMTPKCAARNQNAIGVDLLERKLNMRSGSVADRDWYFGEKVLEEGARLVASLADRYNIPQERIIRHYDVTGKWCPRPFVGQDINAATGATHEEVWLAFKERIRRLRQ